MHSLPGVLLSQPLLPSKPPSPWVKFPRDVQREEGEEEEGGGGGGKGRLSGPQAVFESKVGQLFLTLVFGGEER